WQAGGLNTAEVTFKETSPPVQVSASAQHENTCFEDFRLKVVFRQRQYLANTGLLDSFRHILGDRNVFRGGLRGPRAQRKVFHPAGPADIFDALLSQLPPVIVDLVVGVNGDFAFKPFVKLAVMPSETIQNLREVVILAKLGGVGGD